MINGGDLWGAERRVEEERKRREPLTDSIVYDSVFVRVSQKMAIIRRLDGGSDNGVTVCFQFG